MSQPSPARPEPFSVYTTPEFWGDAHISAQMLAFHLDSTVEASSRPLPFVDRSAAWIVDRFGVGAETRVLDLGCGPGLYAMRLARVGALVTGVDVSARSLTYARDSATAEGFGLTLVHGSYLEVDLGASHELALVIYEDSCALSPAQRLLLLGRVRDALASGGYLLLGARMLSDGVDFAGQSAHAADQCEGKTQERQAGGILGWCP